jgi:hypothetical protein
VALAGALPSCPLLTTLDLLGNGLGEAGGVALAGALPSCPLLTTLNLRWNGLGEVARAALAVLKERLLELAIGKKGRWRKHESITRPCCVKTCWFEMGALLPQIPSLVHIVLHCLFPFPLGLKNPLLQLGSPFQVLLPPFSSFPLTLSRPLAPPLGHSPI